MNSEKLFALQRDLNLRIETENNLIGKPLLTQRLLGLHVALGQLANETRCFNYWDNEKPASKEVLLEKYVNCLNFILALGLERNFIDLGNIPFNPIEGGIVDQFLNLNVDMNDFIVCTSMDHYITLFEDFLSLGLSLGFTEEEIESKFECEVNKYFILN